MAFTCQVGLKVVNERQCEHCGARLGDVCRRLPTLLQARVDSLLGALRKAREYVSHELDMCPVDDEPEVERDLAQIDAAIAMAEGREPQPVVRADDDDRDLHPCS